MHFRSYVATYTVGWIFMLPIKFANQLILYVWTAIRSGNELNPRYTIKYKYNVETIYAS